MRSMQIVEWGEPLEMRTKDAPQPKGTEILVAIEACGVCHSDIHIWEGYFDLGNGEKLQIPDRGVKLPFTLGHEPAGRVVSVGPDADSSLVGKRFAIYPWFECGSCEACNNGLAQACDFPTTIGTRRDGAYSDFVIVPDAKYLVDFSGIDIDRACTLVCSGLTAFSAIKKIEPDNLMPDDTVVIIGAGGVGLAALCIAKALCKAKIIVADINSDRRAAALKLGATAVCNPAEESVAAQMAKNASSAGAGIAASIDFVGLPQTIDFSFNALRKGGLHIHVGLFGGAYSMSLPKLTFRMLRFAGSYVGSLSEFRELVELVRSGLSLSFPIAARPLDEAADALEELRSGKVVGRIVLKP
ncbi:MAG: alcohol dehydrogenase [Albidovulum sp.]|nr:alcohol dehydrogenase [Albidovulum sp.]